MRFAGACGAVARGGKRSGRSRWGDEACIELVDAEKSRAVERAERLRASTTNADFRGLHAQVCGSTTRGTTAVQSTDGKSEGVFHSFRPRGFKSLGSIASCATRAALIRHSRFRRQS